MNLIQHTKFFFFSLSTVLVSKAASDANERSHSECSSVHGFYIYWNVFPHMILLLVTVLQESPGRTTSGSPRPAGRAGQPAGTGGSPMAAVKKPDPNMKGNIFWLFLFSHYLNFKSASQHCPQVVKIILDFVFTTLFSDNRVFVKRFAVRTHDL